MKMPLILSCEIAKTSKTHEKNQCFIKLQVFLKIRTLSCQTEDKGAAAIILSRQPRFLLMKQKQLYFITSIMALTFSSLAFSGTSQPEESMKPPFIPICTSFSL